jgi:pimeloyl-ACP methyl ester carboxylesterase
MLAMVFAMALGSWAWAQSPASPSTAQRDAANEPAVASGSKFRIVFDAGTQDVPYSGRVYVALSTQERGEPRTQMGNWGNPAQMFARDVRGVGIGKSVEVDGTGIAFPKPMGDLDEVEYWVQAVARRGMDSPNPGMGEGDLYSKPVRMRLTHRGAGAVELKLTEVVHARTFTETERVRVVEIVSEKLSKFHGREVKMRAGVFLPDGWKEAPDRKYSVVYCIPGFGGDHRSVAGMGRMMAIDSKPVECLLVVPDPTCYYGHSVFADSANNGPWGAALMEELIPAVETKFHGAMSGSRRYVTGVSSGGWSCLWLQVTYPEQFAGCWSHAPDPVDFRDFQRINVYAPDASVYHDEKGARRPLCRDGDRVTIWYDDFVRMESAMGPGGQIGSFEAVFGRKGKDGRPEPLFDRTTGIVDSAAAKAWEKYDIRLVLERNWKDLRPRLKGKLHIYAGEKDNFFLEGAVVRLKETMEKLGSDAEIVVVPGMGHGLHRPGWEAMVKAVVDQRSSGTP